MTTTVVIPWRDTVCPHRTAALGYVMSRYMAEHPHWPVFVATADDESGPWRKAEAVMPAVDAADDGVVIVADADVWCDGVADAVAAVEADAGWAIPHRLVWRLNEAGTQRVLGGESWKGQPLARRQYPGFEGGGIVVADRETLLEVPMPVVDGWGSEDESWACALRTIVGEPWRGDADLVHMWHPPQDRLSRRWGSEEAREVARRYRDATGDPEAMRALAAADPVFVAR